jgi:hypothetical protein
MNVDIKVAPKKVVDYTIVKRNNSERDLNENKKLHSNDKICDLYRVNKYHILGNLE